MTEGFEKKVAPEKAKDTIEGPVSAQEFITRYEVKSEGDKMTWNTYVNDREGERSSWPYPNEGKNVVEVRAKTLSDREGLLISLHREGRRRNIPMDMFQIIIAEEDGRNILKGQKWYRAR